MDDASVVRSFDLTNHEGFFLAAFVCMLGNMFLSFYVVFWLAKLDLRQTTPAECADALNRAVVLELGATLLPALLFLAGSYVGESIIFFILAGVALTRYFWFGTSIVKSEDLRDRANELQKEAYIKMLLLLVVLVFCLVQIVKQLEEIWNPHHAAMHKSLKKQTFL